MGCDPVTCTCKVCHSSVGADCQNSNDCCSGMDCVGGKCQNSQQVCQGQNQWVCSAQAPSTGSLALPCTNGATGCIDSSTTALCTNGAWVASTSCQTGYVCSGGACIKPTTAPGSEVCCPPLSGDPLYDPTNPNEYMVCPGGAMGCTCCPADRSIINAQSDACTSCCGSGELACGTESSPNSKNTCCAASSCKPSPGGNGGSICCPNSNDETYMYSNGSSSTGYSYGCCNSGTGGTQALFPLPASGNNGVTLSVCCDKPVKDSSPDGLCCNGQTYPATISSTVPAPTPASSAADCPSGYWDGTTCWGASGWDCCPAGQDVCGPATADGAPTENVYYQPIATSNPSTSHPDLNALRVDGQECCGPDATCTAGKYCCPPSAQICQYYWGNAISYDPATHDAISTPDSYDPSAPACCVSPNVCAGGTFSANGDTVTVSICCLPGSTVYNPYNRLGVYPEASPGTYPRYNCCNGHVKDTPSDLNPQLCCPNADDVPGKTQNSQDWICCDSATYNTADTGNGYLCCEKPKVPAYDNALGKWTCETPSTCPSGQTQMPDGTCCPTPQAVNDGNGKPLFCCKTQATDNLCSCEGSTPADYCSNGDCAAGYTCKLSGGTCSCQASCPSGQTQMPDGTCCLDKRVVQDSNKNPLFCCQSNVNKNLCSCASTPADYCSNSDCAKGYACELSGGSCSCQISCPSGQTLVNRACCPNNQVVNDSNGKPLFCCQIQATNNLCLCEGHTPTGYCSYGDCSSLYGPGYTCELSGGSCTCQQATPDYTCTSATTPYCTGGTCPSGQSCSVWGFTPGCSCGP